MIYKVLGANHYMNLLNNNFSDLKGYKKVILFRPDEFFEYNDEFYEFTRINQNSNISYEAITLSDWPTFFFFNVLNSCLVTKLYIPQNSIEKKFLILVNRTLNREYRSVLMDEFARFGILTNSLYSWLNPSNYSFKYFDNKQTSLDTELTIEYDFDTSVFKKTNVPLIPAKLVSKVEWNLVLETIRYDGTWRSFNFVTEKSVNAIYSRKPFLIFGVPGANKFLKDMGFDIFDDLIDYDFDNEYSLEIRTQKFVKEVIKINNLSYIDLSDRCHKNFKRIFEIVKNKLKNPNSTVDNYFLDLFDEYLKYQNMNNLIKQLWSRRD